VELDRHSTLGLPAVHKSSILRRSISRQGTVITVTGPQSPDIIPLPVYSAGPGTDTLQRAATLQR
jgi:hypothetical protein